MEKPQSPLMLALFILCQTLTLPTVVLLGFWTLQALILAMLESALRLQAWVCPMARAESGETIFWSWGFKAIVVGLFLVAGVLVYLSFRDFLRRRPQWFYWQGILLGYTGCLVWNIMALSQSLNAIG